MFLRLLDLRDAHLLFLTSELSDPCGVLEKTVSASPYNSSRREGQLFLARPCEKGKGTIATQSSELSTFADISSTFFSVSIIGIPLQPEYLQKVEA
ncbi:hypothetical protein AVEN_139737-1 [Araneus ventricosus]|uniref:Uncharacterized protein n=1 Tax=Araneus ventricosus TaxID=182803 RepID=A0A4Y2KH92_ARAVE|nr:hypothetical protein AVEN_139737-1 [Araneus ventricosus]